MWLSKDIRDSVYRGRLRRSSSLDPSPPDYQPSLEQMLSSAAGITDAGFFSAQFLQEYNISADN